MKSSLWLIPILLATMRCQDITLMVPAPADSSTSFTPVPVMSSGKLQSQFYYQSTCSCHMHSLYVYQQPTALYSNYQISVTNLPAESNVTLSSKYSAFQGTVSPSTCDKSCLLSVTNNCIDKKYAINMFTVSISGLPSFSYMVNCNPSIKYKPFEWGLLLIIILSVFVVTITSIYSRAASFQGFYIRISYPIIIALNLILLVCGILVYINWSFFSPMLNIKGSILGSIGVYIAVNELLWLFNTKINNIYVWRKIRLLDIISLSVAILLLIIYWATGSSWVVSDIMAICLIVACIKFFRIDSLKMGTIFLFSVILLEIVAGLIVHYILRVSYNNFIINEYNSPFFMQLPSITPQLYRKCAWLPALSVIQPGLVISYLRRFDVSRSTWVYLFIGYASLFVGSITWMLIDLATVHTLPLGLISEPLMLSIVLIFAYKRNQNRTLWLGHFHDPDIYTLKTALVRDRETAQTMNLTELVSDLRVSEEI